jgi:hypothetical protein
MEKTVPDNFRSSIVDFTTDLTTTFPEFASLWSKWKENITPDSDFMNLYEHCSQVYPERFFDILNQNAEIFAENSDMNTSFLPGVDFKILYNCDGVSEKTREIIWKYLQVILLILVNTMKDKMDFGDAMKMFEDLDEGDLHSKLQDAMQNIGQFFEKMDNTEPDSANEDTDASSAQSTSKTQGLPQMEEIHNHLQGLFDGKIGQLAKELAEDMSGDIVASFGDDMEGMTSTKDVFSKLMQNPEKIKNVVNTVKDKLTDKMKSGEISREDLMTEASEMMKKMNGGGEGGLSDMFKNMGGAGGMGDMLKSMGGAGGMGDMLKNMGGAGGMGDILKTMGGGGGMANMFKNMNGDADDDDEEGGGMAEMFKNMAQGLNAPKGARLDTNAMNRAQERLTVKERLIARGKARQQEQLVKQIEQQAATVKRQTEYDEFMAKNPNIFDTNDPNSLMYRIDGETQEKSKLRPDGEMSASKKKRLKKKAKMEAKKESDNN